MTKKKTTERGEAWMRIVVLVVSGFILEIWSIVIHLFAVLNWLVTVFSGRRHKWMAEFCEVWNTQMYTYTRYATSMSNKRPFPFAEVGKNISKFE